MASIFQFGVRGGAKTIGHLLNEIQIGETLLTVRDGALLRLVRVLFIDVACETGGIWQRLHEDRQEFVDGRLRRRNLTTSLGEKIGQGENSNELSVIRALREELGIERYVVARAVKTEESEGTIGSFPGLHSHLTGYYWQVEIFPEDFCQNGYIEVQSDKSTFFVWKRL